MLLAGAARGAAHAGWRGLCERELDPSATPQDKMYLNNKVTQLLNNVLVGNVAWQRAAAILRWPLPTNAACMQEKDAQLLQLTEEKMIVKQFTKVGAGAAHRGGGALPVVQKTTSYGVAAGGRQQEEKDGAAAEGPGGRGGQAQHAAAGTTGTASQRAAAVLRCTWCWCSPPFSGCFAAQHDHSKVLDLTDKMEQAEKMISSKGGSSCMPRALNF